MESQSTQDEHQAHQAHQVARLGGARLPADLGISSLGLLMQLAGSLSVAFMAYVAILPVSGGLGRHAFLIFVLGATGIVRGALHRAAGTSILYEGMGRPKRALRTYLTAAVVETLIWAAIFMKLGVAALPTLGLMLALLAWPVTLMIVFSRPGYAELLEQEVTPQAEDLGFEGSGILMLILGVMGSLIGAMILYTFFKLPSQLLTRPEVLLFIGVFMMLLARSVIHAHAGFKATLGVASELAASSAERYYSFGIVSSVVAAGALLVLMMMTSLHPVGLLMIGLVLWLLLLWPLLLRRFYVEKNFSVLLAGAEGGVRRRAPDAGLTALGWVLLGLGVFGLTMALPQLLAGAETNPFLAMLRGGRRGAAAAAAQSPWWGIGIAGVQLWAGIELVRMSDRYKLAANIYGGVATVVTLYLIWPMLKAMKSSLGLGGMGGGMESLANISIFGSIAMGLVVPIVTVLLINRKITPTATARIREPA